MRKSYDVIVIGAGITGASTAYHLKKEGIEHVLLLERRRPAAGGTGKSAAVIRQHYSTPVLVRLTREGIGIFRALPEEIGADAGYVAAGWFFLVPAEAQEAARRNVAMQQSCGVDTRFLEKREIAQRMPWLDPEGVAGVVFEAEGAMPTPAARPRPSSRAFATRAASCTPTRPSARSGARGTG